MSADPDLGELWAWLRDAEQSQSANLASITVTAIIIPTHTPGNAPDPASLKSTPAEIAIRKGTAKPDVIVRGDLGTQVATDWVW
ncbi:MAG: hypothetical protein LBU38_06970, partial [Propionibacteriaceae bacterium]|nr:hypothetical protein [Propionibacteriaceae bacterium]